MVLDTCTVLWANGDHSKLSAAAHASLADGRVRGELRISGITLNEIALLVTRRKITLHTSLLSYLQFLERTLVVLPIDSAIADRAMRFSTAFPKDPADRLIAATAIVHHDRLVTKDRRIIGSGEVDCIW